MSDENEDNFAGGEEGGVDDLQAYLEARVQVAGDEHGGYQEPAESADVADLQQRVAELESLVRRLEEQIEPPTAPATSPGGGGVVVKITGDASGGGKYDGNIMTGETTAAVGGNTAMPEGLTTGDACLIINHYENGKSTHILDANTYHVGVLHETSGGNKVVFINSVKVTICST